MQNLRKANILNYIKIIENKKVTPNYNMNKSEDYTEEDLFFSARRELYLERKENGEVKYANLVKTLYLSQKYIHYNEYSNEFHFNDIIFFISAAASKNEKIKYLGYIGTLINILYKNDEYSILMINTIIKDLTGENGSFSRRIALGFLSNLPLNFLTPKNRKIYQKEIGKYLSVKNVEQEYLGYLITAYYKFNPINSAINISSRNFRVLGIKLQVIIDRLTNNANYIKEDSDESYNINDEISLSENDVLYLKKSFILSANNFILIKTLQLLRLLRENEKKKKNLQENTKLTSFLSDFGIQFYSAVEKRIESTPKTSTISLSIECADFLASCGFSSKRADIFLLKLIEQNNVFLQSIAFRFVRKYNMFKDLLLRRIVSSGIPTKNHLEVLKKTLLNEGNAGYIYQNKENFLNGLKEKGFSEEYIQNVWNGILLEMIKIMPSDFNKKLFKENVSVIFKIEKKISTYLNDKSMKKIVEENLKSDCVDDYLLLYETLSCYDINFSEYEINFDEIYENHMNKMIDCYISGGINEIQAYLSPLIASAVKYCNPYLVYQVLHSKKEEIVNFMKIQDVKDNNISKISRLLGTYTSYIGGFCKGKIDFLKHENSLLSLPFWYEVEFHTKVFRKIITVYFVEKSIGSGEKKNIEIVESDEYVIEDCEDIYPCVKKVILECIDFECENIKLIINVGGNAIEKNCKL